MSLRSHPLSRSGFTLVELAIVLVIIGLIIGGVLAGQELVQQARLRQAANQYTNYIAAAYTFETRYNGLPGDLKNASNFWSDVTSGNGDRLIGIGVYNEIWGFWQHLAKAGLVTGDYTGLPSGYTATLGMAVYGPGPENSPMSPLNKSLWSMMDARLYHTMYPHFGNTLVLNNGALNTSIGDSLRPLEAFSLDVKLDDGLPASGHVQVNLHSWGCYTGSPAVYNTTNENVGCTLLFTHALK